MNSLTSFSKIHIFKNFDICYLVFIYFSVKESALILLQTVPTHIQVTELQEKLLKKVKKFSGILFKMVLVRF